MSKFPFSNHPKLVKDWTTYCGIRDFDEGSHERIVGHLIPSRAEDDGSPEGRAIFQNRQRRLYNINFVNPYLFLHWCHMSQDIELVGTDSDSMQLIRADATGFGASFIQTARERAWMYIRDGRVGTLVDGPLSIAKDRASARALGERSYQINFSATEIRNWDRFKEGPRKGQLSKLILAMPEVYRDGACYERYRVFLAPESDTGGRFTFLDLESKQAKTPMINSETIDMDIVGGGEGGIDRIPFVLWGEGPEESFAKDSWALSKSWMNLNSVVSHIVYNQGFQRTILAGVDKQEVTKLTEWTVTVVAGDRVSIYTIPPGDPVAAQGECDKLKRETHRRSKFEYNQLADDTRQVQSAESKSIDQKVRERIYENTLDTQTDVERRIWQLHAIYEGEPVEAIDVSIAREYGLDDPTAERADLDAVANDARELGVTELRKQVLRIRASRLKYIPSETESVEEIEKKVMDAIDQAQPQAARSSQAINGLGATLFGGNNNGPQNNGAA